MISRRIFCQAATAASILVQTRLGSLARAAEAEQVPSLCALAKERGLLYGSEIEFAPLKNDPDYAALIARHCAIVTPGNEAKWTHTEPQRNNFSFNDLDWLVDFAESHKLQIRGHNLVWSAFNPPWVDEAATSRDAREVLTTHITTVVSRYKGRIQYWDVVNEPTDPRWHPQSDYLVNGIWRKGLGGAYVDIAFETTQSQDPKAVLFINDDGLEYADELSSQKRTLYLRLVEGLVKKGVPISGFGLEAHLLPHRPFAQKDYRQFLAELAGMGLTLHVTELDVNDKSFPADMETRDRLGADYCKQFLETALDEKSVKALLTWGMSDRYNWMNKLKAPNRADGLPSRSFPFDADLRPKPLYYVLAAALKSAPIR